MKHFWVLLYGGKKKQQPIHEQGIMASNITDLIPYSIQFDHHVTVFKR